MHWLSTDSLKLASTLSVPVIPNQEHILYCILYTKRYTGQIIDFFLLDFMIFYLIVTF